MFNYFLEAILLQEWKIGLRESTTLSVIILDIDFFKKYNDGYGHQGGDDCLKEVAKTLSDSMHRPGDFIARYGGEEFVIVMPETALHGAALFAERLRRRVMHHDFGDPGEDPLNLTISIGLASFPDDRVTRADSFVALADQALYRAKNEGRNLVRQ